jgi:hypothetical protein
VSTAGTPFTQSAGVLENAEINWEVPTDPNAGEQRRPFYVLSPTNAGELSDVTPFIQNLIDLRTDPTANRRFVGVSSALFDKNVQNAFANRLSRQFKNPYVDVGNYYDAFYFLAYAMYGAGTSTPLTGHTIAAAMPRLLRGTAFDVGPDDINGVFAALDARGATLELDGTLGPPDFDPTTGSRIDDGSVFCFDANQGTLSLRTNALRYHRDSGELTATASGTQSPFCFPGFFP